VTTYLVTGVNATAALAICRGLAQGHRVIAADSGAMLLAKLSRHAAACHRLPASSSSNDYTSAIVRLVEAERVDVIVPTGKEVLHLSANRNALPPSCSLFADDISKLKRLLDKHAFATAAEGCGVRVPKTILLRSSRRLAESWKREIPIEAIVYRRAFPGWDEGSVIAPTVRQLCAMRPSPNDPWVTQEFVPGQRLRCYAIAVAGCLTAIAPYRVFSRTGKGVEIGFVAISSPEVEDFVRRFVEKSSFTGQIVFDLVMSPDHGLFVIGGKPIVDSGVHLLPSDMDWGGAFSGTSRGITRAGTDKRIGLVKRTCALFMAEALSRASERPKA
jgi:hypothetical protein